MRVTISQVICIIGYDNNVCVTHVLQAVLIGIRVIGNKTEISRIALDWCHKCLEQPARKVVTTPAYKVYHRQTGIHITIL